MTSSVLSACLYALMCFALPGPSGKPLLQGPTPQNLVSSTFGHTLRHRDTVVDLDAKTLILGCAGSSDFDSLSASAPKDSDDPDPDLSAVVAATEED